MNIFSYTQDLFLVAVPVTVQGFADHGGPYKMAMVLTKCKTMMAERSAGYHGENRL